MKVYSEYDSKYGPYERQDGRKIIILVQHDSEGKIINQRTVSYPKYLVENHIGKYLNSDETVDHIDCNISNNDFSNLRIVSRNEHSRSHALFCKEIKKTCVICGKEFVTKNNSRITCGSKRCRGMCAHIDGHNKGNHIARNINTYTSKRSLIQEIVSVETANSGNLLVENPEQE